MIFWFLLDFVGPTHIYDSSSLTERTHLDPRQHVDSEHWGERQPCHCQAHPQLQTHVVEKRFDSLWTIIFTLKYYDNINIIIFIKSEEIFPPPISNTRVWWPPAEAAIRLTTERGQFSQLPSPVPSKRQAFPLSSSFLLLSNSAYLPTRQRNYIYRIQTYYSMILFQTSHHISSH